MICEVLDDTAILLKANARLLDGEKLDMDNVLSVYDTATSFYLPFEQAFSIRAESNSNKLHMVHIWLLATGSHFRYEQESVFCGEFGSDVLYTPKEAAEDLNGFPVNVRIESKGAETDDRNWSRWGIIRHG